ncbi:LLM class flavin-dependent oxidoreductase [Streptacidiphilus sp. PB12-B1b]|uniref:type I polyketide synthase n=1 Tax=Streptacidiphilus sp. PB12-B1b TaxID=2705012 RepID=UPI001CDB912A|nr:type I polyketide synthase [Streptacidiphilus sp. PB12-B1b]QMU75420.1 LLM class flavin-dependent oxidoreductase [Streptacidiphilus sp. PB12-B1b]
MPPPLALSQGAEIHLTGDDPADAVTALLTTAVRAPDAGVVTVSADGQPSTLTYPELLERARRLLSGLRAQGAAPGDHIVLQGLQLPDFFPAFWACLLGGLRPAAIAGACEGGAGGPVLERLVHSWRLLDRPLIVTDAPGAAAVRRQAGRFGPDEPRTVDVAALAGHAPASDHHRPAEDDIALLMLSSGSTGAPKAAQLTHRALAEFAHGARRTLGLDPGDSTLNWLPVDHSGAFLLHHLLEVFVGCTNVHAPTELVLGEPLRWLDLLAEHRTTHTWAPMFGYRLVSQALARNPGRHWDLTPIRILLSGGEQILPSSVAEFLAATAAHGVPGDSFVPAWGMAETTTGIAYGRRPADGAGVHRVLRSSLGGELVFADDSADGPEVLTFVSVGPPEPGAALRIVDGAGTLLPERRIGRLQVRSARVTAGYANDARATAAAFADGDWLETGDLGYLAGGELVITGRAKDVIILNGQNHYCQEIEAAAATVAGVTAGAVGACGVPNPATGSEDLVLLFAARPGDPAEPERIGREVRAALFTRLRLVAARVVAVPTERFPITASGKVRRGELRERLLAGEFDAPAAQGGAAPAAQGSAAPASQGGTDPLDLGRMVREAAAEILGREVDGASPFYELGLTSITLVRLRALLEQRSGLPIPTTALFEHPTVDALTAFLAARQADLSTSRSQDTGPAPRQARPTGPGGSGDDRRIAVIGMAGRFPGAADLDQYWANLRAGADSVSVFTPDQLDRAGIPRELADHPDHRPVAGALDDVDGFDAGFFGMSPSEAELTDPAHRLFLQCCYHALEHAGYAGRGQQGRTGVFAGSGMQLYGHQDRAGDHASGPGADPQSALEAAIGVQQDFLASRVAYRLGLTGPAIGVQTACSTSLVAVHLAVQALLDGDADMALAGAAAVRTPQEQGYRHSPGSILSATGRCRPFDAAADGTVGGNGVAAVLLKRYDRALADGDTVHAVILGTAVNNDGRSKVGFTAPSVAGQVDVVRQALHRAGAAPATISYVEAHGTGTPLGDPVELQALAQALGADRGPEERCAVGSVKANIGHLDTCAGMAGLIKAVLMLQHAELVPTINLDRHNPELDLAGGRFFIPTALRPWPSGSGPRRAGVSALGVGGTNAHVVLEEPPAVPGRPDRRAAVVLPVSAADPTALDRLAERLADHLDSAATADTTDLVAALGLGRPHLPYRRAVVGRDPRELAAALRDRPTVGPARAQPSLAFAFAGQGSILSGAAARLYAQSPVARRVLDDCEQQYRQDVGGSLLDLLLHGDPGDSGAPGDPDAAPVRSDGTAQPALFALQAAQVEAWRSLGVSPGVVLGHSLGEYAALYVAGALTLHDGLWITARRGELMWTRTEPGGMLAVVADRGTAEGLAADTGLDLAAANGPERHVLSGGEAAVAAAVQLLERRDVPWRRLPVERAFHSESMVPALQEFQRYLDRLRLRPLRVPLVTAVEGALLPVGAELPPGYLRRQARSTVDFDAALRAVDRTGCARYVELGPDGSLSSLGRRALPDSSWHPTLRRGHAYALLPALAELYEQGVEIDWHGLAAEGRRVPLPGYPFSSTPLPRRHRPLGRTDPLEEAMPLEEAVPSEDVLSRVVESVARRLGTGAQGLDPDRTFLDQGADSLALMAIARELGKEFDAQIPLRDLFGDTDTPRRLAQRLGTAAVPVPTAVPAAGPAALSATVPVTVPAVGSAAGTAAARSDAPAADLSPAPAVADAGGSAPVLPLPAGPPPGTVAGTAASSLLERQLVLTERMVEQVTGLLQRQLDILATPAAGPAAPAVQPAALAADLAVPVTQLTAPAAQPVAPAAPAAQPLPPAGTATGGTPAPASLASAPAAPALTPRAAAPAAPAPAPAPRAAAPAAPAPAPSGSGCDFSLYFFGDYPDQAAGDKYGLIMEAAHFADQQGFHALWLPERHFHSFGALFPNPSVLAAALATRTSRIRLNAGSVVLPLHNPIRVAEEWSVVDNLSHGRAGLCFASGWHANDFVLAPENFGSQRELMYRRLETVRQLWSGSEIRATSGSGEQVGVRLHPAPVQAAPPMFAAVVGNPESYRLAAEHDLGVVTNLMAQSVDQLLANIALYRRTRAEHGLDPDAGRVVVLLHTYLGEDLDRARQEAFAPFCDYLRSSLSLFDQVTNSLGLEIDLDNTPADDVEFLLEQAYRRYCESRALIGTPDSCAPVVERLLAGESPRSPASWTSASPRTGSWPVCRSWTPCVPASHPAGNTGPSRSPSRADRSPRPSAGSGSWSSCTPTAPVTTSPRRSD